MGEPGAAFIMVWRVYDTMRTTTPWFYITITSGHPKPRHRRDSQFIPSVFQHSNNHSLLSDFSSEECESPSQEAHGHGLIRALIIVLYWLECKTRISQRAMERPHQKISSSSDTGQLIHTLATHQSAATQYSTDSLAKVRENGVLKHPLSIHECGWIFTYILVKHVNTVAPWRLLFCRMSRFSTRNMSTGFTIDITTFRKSL